MAELHSFVQKANVELAHARRHSLHGHNARSSPLPKKLDSSRQSSAITLLPKLYILRGIHHSLNYFLSHFIPSCMDAQIIKALSNSTSPSTIFDAEKTVLIIYSSFSILSTLPEHISPNLNF